MSFGYLNPNAVDRHIRIGSGNRFLPAPVDRGQPADFLPGRAVAVFAVPLAGDSAMSWLLDGARAKASADLPACLNDDGCYAVERDDLAELTRGSAIKMRSALREFKAAMRTSKASASSKAVLLDIQRQWRLATNGLSLLPKRLENCPGLPEGCELKDIGEALQNISAAYKAISQGFTRLREVSRRKISSQLKDKLNECSKDFKAQADSLSLTIPRYILECPD